MNNIQSFTTLATKMGQKPSAGNESITPREQQTLARLLGEMSAGEKGQALKALQGINPELYATLSKGW